MAGIVAAGTVPDMIVAVNTGEAPTPPRRSVPLLAGALDDATYNGDAAASGGAPLLRRHLPGLDGALPVNATPVITFSVTVNALITGEGSSMPRSPRHRPQVPPRGRNRPRPLQLDHRDGHEHRLTDPTTSSR